MEARTRLFCMRSTHNNWSAALPRSREPAIIERCLWLVIIVKIRLFLAQQKPHFSVSGFDTLQTPRLPPAPSAEDFSRLYMQEPEACDP